MALVELGRYFNSFDAGLDKGRLDAAGIMSFMFDTEMNWEGDGRRHTDSADGRRRGSRARRASCSPIRANSGVAG